jgi:hypothetical protein
MVINEIFAPDGTTVRTSNGTVHTVDDAWRELSANPLVAMYCGLECPKLEGSLAEKNSRKGREHSDFTALASALYAHTGLPMSAVMLRAGRLSGRKKVA